MSVSLMYAPARVQIPPFPTLKFHSISKPLLRRRQRPFRAPTGDGPYRLPKAVQDRLECELAAFRNAEAAFALALFIGRFWSVPNRLGLPFPIDRRALVDHQALGLSEGEIRGAIRTLERVEFLKRPLPATGSRYRATADGLKRKAILFEFGSEFAPIFQTANQRSKGKSGRRSPVSHSKTVRLPPSRIPSFLKSPKNKIALGKRVFMGQLSISNPEDETGLEKSLSRLAEALGLPKGDADGASYGTSP